MNTITAIIIDDEAGARKTLQTLLAKYCPNVKVLDEVQDVTSGFVAINQHQPDLVFLDIQIGTEQGFDLLKKFKMRNFQLIFTTAYSQFGLEAIKEQAIDYLVKPIDIDELILAVSKVPQRNEGQSYQSRLILPTNNGHEVIGLESILYCEADNNYTNLYLTDGRKVVASKTLKTIENQLPERSFFRTHRSFVVNLTEIQLVGKGKDGTVTLKSGDELYLSRDRKEELIQRLGTL